jgi:hypothetical protein
MKIVKFKSGKYGVRKGWLSTRWLTVTERYTLTWQGMNPNGELPSSCKGSFKQALDAMERINTMKVHKWDSGEAVNPDEYNDHLAAAQEDLNQSKKGGDEW